MDYTWRLASPLGGITLASDGEALCGLWFDGQKQYIRKTRCLFIADTADLQSIPDPVLCRRAAVGSHEIFRP